MTDIVRHFESICADLKVQFEHGDISYLNLAIANSVDPNKIFMLSEPPQRQSNFSTGNVVTGKTYIGAFSLVKKSSIDEQYLNEKTPGNNSNSKFTLYIEPMIQLAEAISKTLVCMDDITVLEFGCLELINFLDANRDGVIVRYRIRQDV